MEEKDRRVRRTQNLLARALIDLTLEKGYEAVTIRDITERADVGYATFFRHYPDKEALLVDVLNVFLEELVELLRSIGDQSEMAGTLVFRYVQEHNELCRVLLSTHGSAPLLRHIYEAGAYSVLEQNIPLEGSPVPPEIAAHHLVASSIALIQWWLERDMPYPPEQMGQIYHELIIRPTKAIAFK